MIDNETKKRRGRPPKNNVNIPTPVYFRDILKSKKFKMAFGIFLLFLTIFLVPSFVSFLFTWREDMSVFDMSLWELLTQTQPPANTMGKLGAFLSKIFIHNLFGISAYGFLAIFPLWGLVEMGLEIKWYKKFLWRTLYMIFWLSLILGYIFGKRYFNLGGAVGFYISEWLVSIFGNFGTILIFTMIFSVWLFLTVKSTYEWTKIFFKNIVTTKSPKFAFSIANQKIKIFGKNNYENIENDNLSSKENPIDDNEEEDDDFDDEDDDIDDDLNSPNNIKVGLNINNPNKTVENKDFILLPDGTKIPKNKGEIGFEVDKNKIIEETVDENIQQVVAPLGEEQTGLEVHTNEDILGEQEQLEDYDPTKTLSFYKLPLLSLLKEHKSENSEVSEDELLENRNKIVETLKNYKIEITKIKATVGPTVTLYEIVPAPGVRIAKIKNLEDDIALSLSALGIRIIAPMPGRGTIGIEVPNKNPSIVSMRSVLSAVKYQKSDYELPIAMGKTISNETYVFDLSKMPHLLVAGATGQGKSVGINAIIASLLYKKHPAYVKFVLIDPKKVELVLYERLVKHYLAMLPNDEEAIVTDNRKVVSVLSSLNVEMDARYQLLKDARVREIKEYNEKFIQRHLNPRNGHRFMPYIVVVIDEFADLIMTAGKEVELPLARIAQLARAVGIHLIVATQRPSTNIITGVIKANFPARIAFRVSSMIDSRTILDTPGANQLIGRGDMLLSRGSELIRLQCAFIDTSETNSIVDHISGQIGYPTAYELPEPVSENSENDFDDIDLKKRDPLFDAAARLVVATQQGSTSLIQRKLSIGFARAGRIMDQLEAAGIVGPQVGSKPREVYYYDEIALNELLKSLDVM